MTMTTCYAFCRDYEEGDSFPYINYADGSDLDYETEQCSPTRYECWAPDCIEDDEFNLVIMLDGYPVKARGIHFDFEYKEHTQED